MGGHMREKAMFCAYLCAYKIIRTVGVGCQSHMHIYERCGVREKKYICMYVRRCGVAGRL